MYEKVIFKFFDETPSMIEENSQEDEDSKTGSRIHQTTKLSSIVGRNSNDNRPSFASMKGPLGTMSSQIDSKT